MVIISILTELQSPMIYKKDQRPSNFWFQCRIFSRLISIKSCVQTSKHRSTGSAGEDFKGSICNVATTGPWSLRRYLKL